MIVNRMAVAVAVLTASGLCGAADIWWEGESPVATNFPNKTWFSPHNDAERYKLSGGNWLSNDGERKSGEAAAYARYDITVPEDGKYQLWARKFWKHGPFRWRFVGGEWQTCGRDIALADSVTLRTHVPANWVHLGEVELTAGKHRFEMQLTAGVGEKKTAAFDAFLLTTGTFQPRGKLRPGQRSGLADPGFFAWEPQADPFTDKAMLDLRYLNEPKAGANGYVKAVGGDLQLGDGTPVRFWAVNLGNGNIAQSRDLIDYLARKLAKLGVNMVRFHGPLFQDYQSPDTLDPKKLDNLQYLVHAMAEQGIYTKISFYFPLWFDGKQAGLEGFDTIENTRPFALLYFDKKMQGIYRSWLEQLLTTPSPYDGVPLGRNPAVAMVEIINEDSLFFWTFSKANVPAVHWRRLEALYGRHLGQAGPATIKEAWHMTGDAVRRQSSRARQQTGRQVKFLAELQREFYADTVKRIRALGYRGLVSASNWKVTDPAMLEAIERYTYTAGDVIDHHGYFHGKHEGEGASYSVRVGHRFENLSGLTSPQRLPMAMHQMAGHPHIISELNWPNPNRYRGEATTVTAAYAALQGIDGVFWFSVGANAMADQGMTKFQVADPAIGATLPANALIYRKRLVSETEPVIDEVISLDDLYAMKGSAAATDQALDALREADIPQGERQRGRVTGIDPLSFYVGKVQRRFGDPTASSQIDISRYIDRRAKTVKSTHGQLHLDYDKGVLMINTAMAAGMVGFIGEKNRTQIGEILILCRNEFASVLVVSLDDRPIAESKRLLIQTMTESQPYGYKTEGGRITNLGGPPLGVREIRCAIKLPWDIGKVTALDENGYPTDRPVPSKGDIVELRPDAIWHIVER